VTRRNPPDFSARQRRWILVSLIAWVLVGTIGGELGEPPFDLVRFVFRLVLGGLLAWFFVWLVRSPLFRRGKVFQGRDD
jgi:hypothetical protein